ATRHKVHEQARVDLEGIGARASIEEHAARFEPEPLGEINCERDPDAPAGVARARRKSPQEAERHGFIYIRHGRRLRDDRGGIQERSHEHTRPHRRTFPHGNLQIWMSQQPANVPTGVDSESRRCAKRYSMEKTSPPCESAGLMLWIAGFPATDESRGFVPTWNSSANRGFCRSDHSSDSRRVFHNGPFQRTTGLRTHGAPASRGERPARDVKLFRA